MRNYPGLFIISICLTGIVSSMYAETVVLKSLPEKQVQLQGTVTLEQSTAPLQLNTITTIQPENLQLNAGGLEAALAESNQLIGLKKSPLPKWLAVRQDDAFPLYGLTKFADGKAGIELLSFGKNSDVPETLTQTILSKRPKVTAEGASPNQYSIDGILVVAVFDAIKIDRKKNLYISAFGSNGMGDCGKFLVESKNGKFFRCRFAAKLSD